MIAADPSRVHERGGDGQTPLHFARSRAVIDLVLDAGADIDARDVDHCATAAEWMLDHTHSAGRYELARYLLERGAHAEFFSLPRSDSPIACARCSRAIRSCSI